MTNVLISTNSFNLYDNPFYHRSYEGEYVGDFKMGETIYHVCNERVEGLRYRSIHDGVDLYLDFCAAGNRWSPIFNKEKYRNRFIQEFEEFMI